jgi:hypothetical protein
MARSKRPKYLLGIDCETTGLFFTQDLDKNFPDPSYNPNTGQYFQSVSWGLIVIDNDTLEIVDQEYVEIKWDGVSKWEPKAEATHGLSVRYLKEHGMSNEDAAVTIREFIFKYWEVDENIVLLGHNVMSFDVFFLRRLLNEFDLMPKISNRCVDTNTIAMGLFDMCGSDELFELLGTVREAHNALEDIILTFEAYKLARQIGQKFIGGTL